MHAGSYQDLAIWKNAMEIADLIYEGTENFPKNEEYGLKSQMRRSAISVPSNIAEGSQRGSDKEFSHFISIAKGSLAELETQILLSERRNILKFEKIKTLKIKIEELHKMLYAFRRALKAHS